VYTFEVRSIWSANHWGHVIGQQAEMGVTEISVHLQSKSDSDLERWWNDANVQTKFIELMLKH
jgi:hypothetical protein